MLRWNERSKNEEYLKIKKSPRENGETKRKKREGLRDDERKRGDSWVFIGKQRGQRARTRHLSGAVRGFPGYALVVNFPKIPLFFHPNYLIYHATLMIWSSLAGPTYRFIRSRPFIPSRRRHSALMRRHLSRFIGFREKGSLGMWWCGATFFGGLLRHFVVVVVEKENPSAWISHVPCSLGTCLKRKIPFLRVGINNISYII